MLLLLLFFLCLTRLGSCSHHKNLTCSHFEDCVPSICNLTTKHCQPCHTNEDCEVFRKGLYVCLPSGHCDLKPFFSRFRWQDAVVCVMLYFAIAFAALGGLGGGSLAIPILYLVGNYPFIAIPPLTLAKNIGGGVGNVLILLFRGHPDRGDRPVINFGFVALFEPFVLAGTFIGVILNAIFPSWACLVGFVLVAGISSIRITIKAIRLCREDQAERKKAKEDALEAEAELDDGLSLDVTDGIDDPDALWDDGDDEEEGESEKDDGNEAGAVADREVLAEEEELYADESDQLDEHLTESGTGGGGESAGKEKFSGFGDGHPFRTCFTSLRNCDCVGLRNCCIGYYPRFPLRVFGVIIVVWVIVFFTALLLGSNRIPSAYGIAKCTPLSWVVLGLAFVLILSVSLAYAGTFFLHRGKLEAGHTAIKWTCCKVFILPIVFILSGTGSGLIGIGGGMVNNPILYSLGIKAESVIATSLFGIFLTASSAVSQFLVNGSLTWDYFIVFFIVGCAAHVTARIVSYVVIRKLGRVWIIVGVSGIVIFIAMCLTLGIGIMRIVKHVDSTQFASYCGDAHLSEGLVPKIGSIAITYAILFIVAGSLLLCMLGEIGLLCCFTQKRESLGMRVPILKKIFDGIESLLRRMNMYYPEVPQPELDEEEMEDQLLGEGEGGDTLAMIDDSADDFEMGGDIRMDED